MQRRRVAAAVLLAVVAAACAAAHRSPEERARRIDALLAASGFRPIPADTPERLTHLRSLPPLRLRRVVTGGTERYWLADPYLCRCLYVGDAQNRRDLKALLASDAIAGDTVREEEYAGMLADDLRPEDELEPLTDPFGPFAF